MLAIPEGQEGHEPLYRPVTDIALKRFHNSLGVNHVTEKKSMHGRVSAPYFQVAKRHRHDWRERETNRQTDKQTDRLTEKTPETDGDTD